jgi:hypothetical protein
MEQGRFAEAEAPLAAQSVLVRWLDAEHRWGAPAC